MGLYSRQIAEIANDDAIKYLAGKKIMLTGASGMVGKAFIDVIMEYNKHCSVAIEVLAVCRDADRANERFAQYIDSPYLHIIAMDINEGITYDEPVDIIIHAASNTHPIQYSTDPVGTIATNVIGTKNLLDYAIACNVPRFCFISSVEIYGENTLGTGAFAENDLGYIDCNTVRAGYPESKRIGETLCNAYAAKYGIEFNIVRLSRCYGPTMLTSDSKAIAQFIKKAVNGEDIVLKSEGNQLYSYTYVTDAVSAIMTVMSSGIPGRAYNVADKLSDITLKELAGLLADIGASKVVYELPDETEKKGYSAATIATLDASELEKLGWCAKIHMSEGLLDVVDTLRG